MISRENLKDLCPLTPMQEGMLYHAQLDSHSTAYHEKITFFLNGDIDVACYRQAWQLLVARHDILRSVFVINKTQHPLQAVLKQAEVFFQVQDYSQKLAQYASLEKKKQILLEQIYQADQKQGFDLTAAVPLRLSLYAMGEKHYCLFWSFHHILLDGWSVNLLMQEMGEIYAALLAGQEVNLASVLPFKHYLQWMEKQDKNEGIEFWQSYLADYQETISLPGCGVAISKVYNSKANVEKTAQHVIPLPATLSKQIEQAAQQQQVTANAIVQAAWGILLSRYNDCSDVLYASVVSGRPSEIVGIESMVGLFINTLPVRVRFSWQESIAELLQRLHLHNSESQAYQFLPMAEIQPRHAAPDHLLVFENYLSGNSSTSISDSYEDDENHALQIDEVKVREQTNYDFTLVLAPGEIWQLTCLYAPTRYGETYISQVMEHFIQLLHSISLAAKETTIKELDMLKQHEQQQILSWAGEITPYPDNLCIAEVFEQIVERNGEQTALCNGPDDEPEKYTYAELNQQVNHLSWSLIEQGVGAGDIVAIHLPRSCQRVISVLAVIKAGAAYLGIEMDTPVQRLKYLCADAAAKAILTNKTDLSLEESRIIAPQAELADVKHIHNPKIYVAAQSFAYISYTSGSTGTPKGVCATQQNVLRLVKNNSFIQLQRNERFLQFAPLSFDASTLEIWAPLLNACRLSVIAQEKPGLEQIADFIQQQRITCLWLSAGLFQQMVDNCLDRLTSVRQLLAGGDVISAEHVKRLLNYHPDMIFINGYGPTENTTFSCCYRSDDDAQSIENFVPIGHAIKNSRAYVLDRLLRIQPIGATGELYVGGDGVSLGYWRKASQTAAVFVPDCFNGSGQRMYRTGDRVNYIAPGSIAFQGRVDQQFKVRGYRIEAQEVENSLKNLPDVQDAVVIVAADKQADKLLVAYLICTASKCNDDMLKQQLGQSLPHYLIPDLFIQMDSFPLNANGKIDRNRLPSPFLNQLENKVVEPRNPLEQQLFEIWKQVLSVEYFGIDDDFFQLGGHSLKATQVVSLLKKQLNVEVPLRLVFEAPTISAFGQQLTQLDGAKEDAGPKLKRADRRARRVPGASVSS